MKLKTFKISSKTLAYFLLFFLSFTLTILYHTIENAGWINRKIFHSVDYTPSYRATSGYELLFIYIGSSRCGWSNIEELPKLVKSLKQKVKAFAEARGYRFVAVGIAAEWSVDDGIRHLAKFGGFDEIIAGRNWNNTGVIRYVWEDLPGEAATPQVLIVRHRLLIAPQMRVFESPQLLTRKVGVDEIRRWNEHFQLRDVP